MPETNVRDPLLSNLYNIFVRQFLVQRGDVSSEQLEATICLKFEHYLIRSNNNLFVLVATYIKLQRIFIHSLLTLL